MQKLATLLFIFIECSAHSQTVISQWNFNSALPPDFNLLTGSTEASMGQGTIRLIGNAGPSNANPFNDGSNNDCFTNGLDNSAWNITKFPVQGMLNKTAGIQCTVNTLGFQNIFIKFDEKHSNSSANTTVVQYNTDTLNTAGWIDIQTNKITASPFSADWFTHLVDLSAIPSVNNQPRLGVRIVAAFDPGNGANYISTLNQTANTYNATGGTIRWDMITITGTPVAGCTLPTIQASDANIITTSGAQVSFSFDRGNGDSVLVLCREGFAVNNYPQSGTTYTGSAIFGAGAEVGIGNFAVYNSALPGRNSVTVNGLTPGKVYFFAVFEYSATSLCYKQPPLYFHVSVDGTVLNPGELFLMGFDTRIPGAGTGNDKIYVGTLVDILPGTQFSLVSSRYEAGAAPNVRTNRWYNSGDYIYKDPDVQEFTWTGTTTIPAGSIISIQDKIAVTDQYDSLSVNGIYQPLFISDKQKGAFNIPTATTKGEQVYITQGSFYPTGDFYNNRYNVLTGKVLFGMSLLTNWVPFSASPGVANAGIGFRESRIPPDILCINIVHTGADTLGAAVYAGPLNETKRYLKINFTDPVAWLWKAGDIALNISENFVTPPGYEIGQTLTIIPSPNTDGTWVGDKNTEWFDCANWEGMFVPDSSSNVTVRTPAAFNPVINTTDPAGLGILYSNHAAVKTLTMEANAVLTLIANSNLLITGHN